MATSDSTNSPITLQLTKGFTGVIDATDSELATHKWRTWTNGTNHYVVRTVRVDGHNLVESLHRIVMARILDRPLLRSEVVDHIDGNGLNNQRSNLRLASNSQNIANSRISKNNRSGYKGIYWLASHKKWRAEIRVRGQQIFLGMYDTPEEAHEAYKAAALDHFGEFARFQ